MKQPIEKIVTDRLAKLSEHILEDSRAKNNKTYSVQKLAKLGPLSVDKKWLLEIGICDIAIFKAKVLGVGDGNLVLWLDYQGDVMYKRVWN